MQALARPLVEALIARDVRRAFESVRFVGEWRHMGYAQSLVLYANHHSFFDGHLLWILARRALGRPVTIWMRNWERFPFFAAAGALPFPTTDAATRIATIRETSRRMHADPRHVLLLFPEGEMHPVEEGIRTWPDDQLIQLERVLPTPSFCPIAIHPSWRRADRPTAFLAAGAVRSGAAGAERQLLATLLLDLPKRSLGESEVLLAGKRSMSDRWNFQLLASLFKGRY